MAEHNGGNRGGNDRGGFRGHNNSGGEPRGFRSRPGRDNTDPSKRAAGGGERKPFGDRDKKPFGDRPRREGEGDRRGFGGGERKPFGDRDRKPLGGGERKPYGDRENRSFGDRPRRDGEGERRGFGGGERKPFGDRDRKPYGDRENRPFGDRPRGDGEGDRRGYGGGENRKPFGDRSDRPNRGDRQEERRAPRSFDRGPGRGESRGDAGPRTFGRDRQEERPARVPNVRDLRSANRPDRERSPQIDDDVTGKELDRATQHQIKTLEANSAEWVARHLVMAGRLIDDEPELAFQHALAASRRGGRLAAVREAVGLTAYAAGHYGEALREFRTYRRISGSNVHLPVMADCERGLGRPDRALDVVRSEEAQDLDAPGKVELAIVAAGARTDLGQLDAAVAELEIPQLDMNRAFSYSPRLFRAYADALAAVGRTTEADKWQKQAVVAENALGLGVDEEPDIIDLGWDEEEEAREEAERRRLLDRASTASGAATTSPAASDVPATSPAASTGATEAPAAEEAVDASIDDQEADYFVSDDAESDEDSVEPDELGHDELGHDGDDLPDGSAPEDQQDQQDRRED
jgi:tetratricopeptide (TPR) repeat protein